MNADVLETQGVTHRSSAAYMEAANTVMMMANIVMTIVVVMILIIIMMVVVMTRRCYDDDHQDQDNIIAVMMLITMVLSRPSFPLSPVRCNAPRGISTVTVIGERDAMLEPQRGCSGAILPQSTPHIAISRFTLQFQHVTYANQPWKRRSGVSHPLKS